MKNDKCVQRCAIFFRFKSRVEKRFCVSHTKRMECRNKMRKEKKENEEKMHTERGSSGTSEEQKKGIRYMLYVRRTQYDMK